MIYLDCAATTQQKPRSVSLAVSEALRLMSSPGRGGYKSAMRAADCALDCRILAGELFNVDDPEKVIFTMNATHALNIAIRSLARPGCRVVVSGYEHNSVTRPLAMLGADIRTAQSALFDSDAAVEAFERELEYADFAVCTHVSNVFGYVLPIERISKLCRERSVPLIIDASQSAGTLPVNMGALSAAFIAMPGHKGLFGPQGTGLLLCGDAEVKPLMAGGTGSNSIAIEMPEFLPDRLEAGTHNMPGINGLLAGMRFVKGQGTERILRHERELLARLAARLKRIEGLELFLSADAALQTGVLSVRYPSVECVELAERLSRREVAVRAGLHCSPFAHRSAGTLDTGTLRFSVSPFNTAQEIDRAAAIFAEIVNKL